MTDGIKEEEFRANRSLDKHNNTASDDCKKSDDVENANSVENDVAWTNQRFP